MSSPSISNNCFVFSSLTNIPELWVESEAETILDTSCSPLPLEGAGFRNKSFHQRAHLAALMVPEQKSTPELLSTTYFIMFSKLL